MEPKIGFRRLKAEILERLRKDGCQPSALDDLDASSVQKVSPLISLLYHGHALVRWRSIAALGHVVSQMAAADFEAARVVMRRLMWNLNDESGGIGWGAPAAMAEIMARNPRLADEYATILVSYLNPRGNFLEHPGLQCDVLWGIGRVGRIRADRVMAAAPHILPFFDAPDPVLRGLAVWSGAALERGPLWCKIRTLESDTARFTIYLENYLRTCTVSDMVAWVSCRRKTGCSSELISP